MKFYEIIDQVIALLHSRGRLSYRALSVEFDLNENSLTTLKEELIEAQGIARDENGKVLVWTGERPVVNSSSIPSSRSPITYTPAHLAERICVEQTAIEARGKSIIHRSSKLTSKEESHDHNASIQIRRRSRPTYPSSNRLRRAYGRI